MRLFDQAPGARDALYAEAQSLVDEGLELSFVLGLYPEDADWLAPLLETAGRVSEAYEATEPSFYFESSLKAKFLGAARVRFEPERVGAGSRVKRAFAAGSVMAGAGAMAVLTLAFLTSGAALPGDWNYGFKLTQERLEYALSRGSGRLDAQIRQTEARVQEVQALASQGEVSPSVLQELLDETVQLRAEIEREKASAQEPGRQEKLRKLTDEGTTAVRALPASPPLEQKAASVARALEDTAQAAGIGPVATLTPEPEPAPEPTATPTEAPSPTATPSPTPAPPETTPTLSPSPTPAPTETEPATATAAPAETASPEVTPAAETPTPHPATPPAETSTPDSDAS
jgi:hypothetical protein